MPIRAAAVLLTMGCCIALAADPIKEIQKRFSQLGGFTFLPVQRNDYEVGALIGKLKNRELFITKSEECFDKNFISDLKKQAVDAKTFAFNDSFDFDIDVGAKLTAMGMITSDIDAEFARKHVKSMTLDFGEMTIYGFSLRQMTDYVSHSMKPTCRDDFAFISGSSLPRKERMVIMEVVQSSNYLIKFKDDRSTTVTFKTGIVKKLFPSIKISGHPQEIAEIKPDRNYHVAIKPLYQGESTRFAGAQNDLHLVPASPKDTLQLLGFTE
jgi:hypothetical protein